MTALQRDRVALATPAAGETLEAALATGHAEPEDLLTTIAAQPDRAAR